MKKAILGFVLIVVALSCHKETATDLIYQTDFNTNNNAWSQSCDSYVCRRYNQGQYEIEIDQAGYSGWSYEPSGLLNTTYSMSVDCVIHLDDPTKWGTIGFIYNWIDNTNFKLFQISSYGHYAVFQKLNGVYTTLNAWTTSPAINAGSGTLNTIALSQEKNSIEFKVNGTSLGVFPYSQSYNFKVGLMAGSSGDFTRVIGSFDNFVVKRIP